MCDPAVRSYAKLRGRLSHHRPVNDRPLGLKTVQQAEIGHIVNVPWDTTTVLPDQLKRLRRKDLALASGHLKAMLHILLRLHRVKWSHMVPDGNPLVELAVAPDPIYEF